MAVETNYLLMVLRFFPLPVFDGMILGNDRCFVMCGGFLADQNCGPRGRGRFGPDAHGMFAFAPGLNAAQQWPDALDRKSVV